MVNADQHRSIATIVRGKGSNTKSIYSCNAVRLKNNNFGRVFDKDLCFDCAERLVGANVLSGLGAITSEPQYLPKVLQSREKNRSTSGTINQLTGLIVRDSDLEISILGDH